MSCRKSRKGSPQRNVPNESGWVFSAIFDQYVVISRKRCILTGSIYDSCMMSVFTCDAVQNVYAQFRSHLDWLRTFTSFYTSFYFILYFILHCICICFCFWRIKVLILDTKLLWDGNRKPYANYRLVSHLMTLSDP